MGEEIINMKDESDPIVVQFRSLVELLRYFLLFYLYYISILLPLVGLILGYIIYKNSVIPSNKKHGKNCMIIGIVFMVVAVVCIIIYIFAIVAMTGGIMQELSSGGYY